MRAALIGLAALLAGCAPATYQGLQEEHAGTVEFRSERNYQETYRLLRRYAEKCHAAGSIPLIQPSVQVEGELYTDIQEGRIWIRSNRGFSGQTPYGLTVYKDGSGSRVKAYYAHDVGKDIAQRFKHWVRNNPGDCRLPE